MRKVGRQLSVASNGNHYTEHHRQEAERALNGNGGLAPSVNGPKESFFSHLRKRARRLSGRNQVPHSPKADDLEANAGCGPWSSSNRSSMALDPTAAPMQLHGPAGYKDTDSAGPYLRGSVDASSIMSQKQFSTMSSDKGVKKIRSLQQSQSSDSLLTMTANGVPISSRTRRAAQMSSHPVHRYETPDEEDELLDEVIKSAHNAAQRLDRNAQLEGDAVIRRKQASARQTLQHTTFEVMNVSSYPTPSPSSKRNSVYFDPTPAVTGSAPIDMQKRAVNSGPLQPKWPTPPYEESWADAAAASLFAAGAAYR